MNADQRCSRCNRSFPGWDDPEATYWEAFGPDGAELICPGCITGEEQQALDEAEFHIADTTALEDPSDPRDDALDGGRQ